MPSAAPAPLRILLSGSTGFLGRHLATARRALGDHVTPLLRSVASAQPNFQPKSQPGVHWNADGDLDPAAVSGFDAIIHLAGEPVADGRWTAAKKDRIWQSRVTSTQRLVRALAAAPQPPKVLLCASGINVYGDCGNTLVDESTPAGQGFLPEVCVAWEAAAAALTPVARVVQLRISVVLDPSGGAFARMLPLFRLGLGGPIGGGHAFLSWVTLADLLAAINHALISPTLHGPTNICTPNPVTGRDFAQTVAAQVHRPAILPVPAWAIRLALGQMAEETLLASVRALPTKLTQDGFTFQHPDLSQAVAAMLSPRS